MADYRYPPEMGPRHHTEPSDVETRNLRRAILMRRLAAGAVICLVLATLVIVTINTVMARHTGHQIASCVTPGGKCYVDGQHRTEAALTELLRARATSDAQTRQIVILAAACAAADPHPTVPRIRACVVHGLHSAGH